MVGVAVLMIQRLFRSSLWRRAVLSVVAERGRLRHLVETQITCDQQGGTAAGGSAAHKLNVTHDQTGKMFVTVLDEIGSAQVGAALLENAGKDGGKAGYRAVEKPRRLWEPREEEQEQRRPEKIREKMEEKMEQGLGLERLEDDMQDENGGSVGSQDQSWGVSAASVAAVERRWDPQDSVFNGSRISRRSFRGPQPRAESQRLEAEATENGKRASALQERPLAFLAQDAAEESRTKQQTEMILRAERAARRSQQAEKAACCRFGA